jgi:rhodanese-related sulfurtransferase
MMALLMGLKTVSCQELHERMARESLTIVDVNALHSWRSARIPGAIHLPVEFDGAALPQDPSAGIVFYCSNPLCRKAPIAAKRAEKMGYSNVAVLSAGITGWTRGRFPVAGDGDTA